MSIAAQGVTVETVTDLYRINASLEKAAAYRKAGIPNPYAGRCRIVPREAQVYAMVPVEDKTEQTLARAMLAAFGKVSEVVADKDLVNFNRFSKGGQVVVFYA